MTNGLSLQKRANLLGEEITQADLRTKAFGESAATSAGSVTALGDAATDAAEGVEELSGQLLGWLNQQAAVEQFQESYAAKMAKIKEADEEAAEAKDELAQGDRRVWLRNW